MLFKDDTYFMLVNTTYQGLTTCQALMGQNYYASVNIAIGAQLTVPMLCACPTANQTAKGVTSLLVYSLGEGDTIKSIGETYGVDEQSILDANEMIQTSNGNRSLNLMAWIPILIPLRGKSCKDDPESFYCTCSQGDVTNSSLMGLNCEESDGKKFPAKLVAALGVGIGAGFLCLFLLGYKLYQCIQKKSKKLHKEKLFKQNGGYLLQCLESCFFFFEQKIECKICVRQQPLFSLSQQPLPPPSPNSSCHPEGASPPAVTNRGLAQSSWPSILFSSTSSPYTCRSKLVAVFTTSSSSSSSWTCRSKCGRLDSSIAGQFARSSSLSRRSSLPVVEFRSFLAACFALPSMTD
ncbi:uncharacterized protein LOC110272485 [Arachis duranensis]|uniref:Uncharacterized protein LOC110272485 n=1 Tax=Arachis duranensis TaxID=130453 RepID=A0A9C6TLW9_ARADU|nr:uncharacterized protein LOC110272485 [Arachis duranensis]